jgi:2-phospho-L-lactate guanylyltransferase
MFGAERLRTLAILPVKEFSRAHERLAGEISAADRARLAEELFLDMMIKVRRCKTVDDVLIVTSDSEVVRHAKWVGIDVLSLAEEPGHSDAAARGIRDAVAGDFERVAVLPTDCPLFDPVDFDAHLGRTPRAALIVPNHDHSGTNALILTPPDCFEPAFGSESLIRHTGRARASGVSFALEEIEGLAHDLDTPEDLAYLREALLVSPERSPRAARILWEIGGDPTEDDESAVRLTDSSPTPPPA